MRAVRRSTGGALLAAVLLLGACGEDTGGTAEDPSSPTESSSEPTAEPTETEPTAEPTESESPGEGSEPTSPACGDIWVADQPFPQKYDGCYDDTEQRWVQAMVYRCSSGQQLVTYRRTFYATKGERVVETAGPLAKDPEFTKALATCGA